MSNSFEIKEVISFLKQKYIITSSDWVEACIAFVKQEHSGQNLPINTLKNYVYQQWLNADLEEIGVSALSTELSTTQKVTLNGFFALQVNGVRDVGKPAYSQLKELDKRRSKNDEFSAAGHEIAVPPWEAKPTRMLMLNLTDGCTSVQGMEYKPINFLSTSLPPGVKVLIQGPVDCRFGIILLTPDKVKVLGGEVESKLQNYSQSAILRELLNLPPANDDSEEHEDSRSLDTRLSTNDSTTLTTYTVPSQSNINIPTIGSQSTNFRNSDSSINVRETQRHQASRNLSESRNIMPPHHQNNFNHQNQATNLNREVLSDLDDFETEDDDFAQSLDYNAIDELEKEISMTQAENVVENHEEEDIWNEDEEVLQDLMAFQDENPVFEIPHEVHENNKNKRQKVNSGTQINLPFTYLSAALKNQLPNCLVTIKGFIMKVLSKLECTSEKGWSLRVQINDGTASIEANIHDKVLEGIIGISAVEMEKIHKQAAQDRDKRRQAMEAISKCKVTLQDYNCLMDIKFSAESKPCIMKCYPVSLLHIQQLLERTRSYT